jgi:hypothetical protein
LVIGLLGEPLRDIREYLANSAALWEFEAAYGTLPTGAEGQQEELARIGEGLRAALGIHPKVADSMDDATIE